MKEIVNKLHENRQIQLAKEILETHGYQVEEKLDEIVSDSDYKDVIRISVQEESDRRIDSEEVDTIMKKCTLSLEILIDNSNGIYVLTAPGKGEWIRKLNEVTGLEFSEIK